MDASRRILEEYYDEGNVSHTCPSWAPTVGFVGIAAAVVFASKFVRSLLSMDEYRKRNKKERTRAPVSEMVLDPMPRHRMHCVAEARWPAIHRVNELSARKILYQQSIVSN